MVVYVLKIDLNFVFNVDDQILNKLIIDGEGNISAVKSKNFLCFSNLFTFEQINTIANFLMKNNFRGKILWHESEGRDYQAIFFSDSETENWHAEIVIDDVFTLFGTFGKSFFEEEEFNVYFGGQAYWESYEDDYAGMYASDLIVTRDFLKERKISYVAESSDSEIEKLAEYDFDNYDDDRSDEEWSEIGLLFGDIYAKMNGEQLLEYAKEMENYLLNMWCNVSFGNFSFEMNGVNWIEDKGLLRGTFFEKELYPIFVKCL